MNASREDFKNTIQTQKAEIAKEIVDRQYSRARERWEPYGDTGYQKSLRDIKYHLEYLSQAAASSSPGLFLDYISWVKVLFARLDFSPSVLPTTLRLTRQVLEEKLAPEMFSIAKTYLDSAEDHLEHSPESLGSELEGEQPLADLSRTYLDLLLKGQRAQASELILEAVAEGVPVKDIYLHVFQRTQHEVGRLWQMNEISVAHEHYCTAATQLIMSQLYPQILSTEKTGRQMIMTCVGDELHELGARMVADFFEMEGWDTYYLGANTPLNDILSTLEEKKPDLLGISTTITYHLDKMGDVIQAVNESPDLSQIPILVGGRPFNIDPELWQKVGADGQAADAQEAIRAGSDLVLH